MSLPCISLCQSVGVIFCVCVCVWSIFKQPIMCGGSGITGTFGYAASFWRFGFYLGNYIAVVVVRESSSTQSLSTYVQHFTKGCLFVGWLVVYCVLVVILLW